MSGMRLAVIAVGVAVGTAGAAYATPTPIYTPITIPANNSIQRDLIAQFPTGNWTANDALATPFQIPSSPATCGYNGTGACDLYDALTNGATVTVTVNAWAVSNFYTLMNAYGPTAGATEATVTFYGSRGTVQSFNLIAGQTIRDFGLNGSWADTLTNGTAGITAENAYYISNVQGGAGTGNVTTGQTTNYAIDEQDFTLSSAFQYEMLTSVSITDDTTLGVPILMGMTAETIPAPGSLPIVGAGLMLAGAMGVARRPALSATPPARPG